MKLSEGQEYILRRLVQFGCLRVEEVDGRTLGALINRGLAEEGGFKVYPSPEGKRWVAENPAGPPPPNGREKPPAALRKGPKRARSTAAPRARRWNAPRDTDIRFLRRLAKEALPLESLSRATVVRAVGQGWVNLGSMVSLADQGKQLLREYDETP